MLHSRNVIEELLKIITKTLLKQENRVLAAGQIYRANIEIGGDKPGGLKKITNKRRWLID